MENAQFSQPRAIRLLGTRVQFEVHASVLLLKIVGPVSASLVRTVRDQLVDEAVLRSARAAVVDVRSGVLLADPHAMAASPPGGRMGITANLPAALLTTEQEAHLYRRYAARAAFAGYIRRVFTSDADALAWALVEASLPAW